MIGQVSRGLTAAPPLFTGTGKVFKKFVQAPG
jgi:hypothetical protein